MKKILKFLLVFCVLITSLTSQQNIALAETEKLYLGGFPAGFSLDIRGAYIVGLTDVLTENGIVSPAKDNDIHVGDKIMSIDGKEVNNANDIYKCLTSETEKTIIIERKKDIIIKNIKPAKNIYGENKLGVFIRENVNGIGTITFIKGNTIASLGHPVLDNEGNKIDIIGGKIANCNITGYINGKRGKAGELRGVFLKNLDVATIEKNTETGIYGKLLNNDLNELKLKEIEIGKGVPGKAEIYSTIYGNTPCKYNIEIIKSNDYTKDKNFVIKIIDIELLNTTGGIVQGMSGSPIVQNGKLVGAVTHVFLNDPTRGFGISVENMLNNI